MKKVSAGLYNVHIRIKELRVLMKNITYLVGAELRKFQKLFMYEVPSRFLLRFTPSMRR